MIRALDLLMLIENTCNKIMHEADFEADTEMLDKRSYRNNCVKYDK